MFLTYSPILLWVYSNGSPNLPLCNSRHDVALLCAVVLLTKMAEDPLYVTAVGEAQLELESWWQEWFVGSLGED